MYPYTPRMSATPFNGAFMVSVQGRFGGGYTCPGKTAEQAATMVLRDAPAYDCGDAPIILTLAPEVEAAIKAMQARGDALRLSITGR